MVAPFDLDGHAYADHGWLPSDASHSRRTRITATGDHCADRQFFAEDRGKVIDAGCNDFLAKPFQEARLFDLMAKYLDIRYRYEDDKEKAHADKRIQLSDEELKQRFEKIPSEIRSQLMQAALELDVIATEAILNKIADYDEVFAKVHLASVREFEFQRLFKLFEGI